MINTSFRKKNNWRHEYRFVKIYKVPKSIGWRESIKTLIVVNRHRKIKWKPLEKEESYFISSLPTSKWAKYFWEWIRWHWLIENSLHYSKDVTFLEDSSKVHTWNQPHNISLFRSMAMNLLRRKWYKNLKQWIRLIQHDIKAMLDLIK